MRLVQILGFDAGRDRQGRGVMTSPRMNLAFRGAFIWSACLSNSLSRGRQSVRRGFALDRLPNRKSDRRQSDKAGFDPYQRLPADATIHLSARPLL